MGLTLEFYYHFDEDIFNYFGGQLGCYVFLFGYSRFETVMSIAVDHERAGIDDPYQMALRMAGAYRVRRWTQTVRSDRGSGLYRNGFGLC